MARKKSVGLAVGLLLTAVFAPAAEVDEALARTALGNWRARNGMLGLRLGNRVQDVRRVSAQGIRFHVVRFEGGGVAIASADTKIRPVIMFSDDSDFDEDPENPAWDILKATLASTNAVKKLSAAPNAPLTENERAWAELAESSHLKYRANSIDDVRVGPLVRARWHQEKAGGYYLWSKMPHVLGSSVPQEQLEAIGKLTSDLGICMAMSYKSGGSGTGTYMAKRALTTNLGYASAMAVRGLASHATNDAFQRILISNFDAKLPVQIKLSNHSIVGDGYGYDRNGQLWYHLNFGWNGTYWYQPPTAATKAEGYTEFEGGVYNIYKTLGGDYVIASGRVTDREGRPAVGKTVTASNPGAPDSVVATATTDEHGIYALFVKPGTYTVSTRFARDDGMGMCSGSTTVSPGKCVSLKVYANGNYDTGTKPVMGNAAFCDISLEAETVATVSIDPAVEKGADFQTARVSVLAQVSTWGREATAATVEVVREAVKRLVEVRADVGGKGGWTKPGDGNIRFADGKVIVTPNPGGKCGFVRVRIPASVNNEGPS